MSILGEERWSVAQSEFCLQRVEECLELSLLFDPRWFLAAAVRTEVVHLLSYVFQRIVLGTIREPGLPAVDPREQLKHGIGKRVEAHREPTLKSTWFASEIGTTFLTVEKPVGP